MASWIVAIANTHPQHWRIAAEHGFWDMTKHADIRMGDTVYFWLTKASLVSKTIALTDAAPLTPADVPPWEDSGVRTYTTRFYLAVLSDDPLEQPRWGTVADQTKTRAGLNFGPQRIDDPRGEAWLAAQFPGGSADVDFQFNATLRAEVENLLGEDLRERAVRAIALRQGQPAFRSALLDAYNSTCAVTAYRVRETLEAAHISPYLGTHTNVVSNGLLLRADVHTLFDKYLLTVDPAYRVRVSPTLMATPYRELHGSRLAVLPSERQARPSTQALQQHHERCAWFSASSFASP